MAKITHQSVDKDMRVYAGIKPDLEEVKSQLSDIVQYNVKNYGAKGDGVTVDTSAVQNAINAANASGGGVVLFPVGTFLTDSLTLYSNVTIRGVSKSNSILKLVDNPSGALLECSGTSVNIKENISIENITLKHIKTFTYVDDIKGCLIRGYYTRYCVVKDCIITDCSVYGIILSQIDNNLTEARSWRISGNAFKDFKLSNKSVAIFLYSEAEYIQITDNQFYNCGYALFTDASANTRFANNTCLKCGFDVTTAVIFITSSVSINKGKTQIIGNMINHSLSPEIKISLPASSDWGCLINDNQILVHNTSSVYDSVSILGGRGHIISNNRIWPVNGSNIGAGIKIADNGATVADYHMVIGNYVIQGGITNTATGTNNLLANNIVNAPV